MKNKINISKLLNLQDPLEILKGWNGFYECPKDESGKRLGPLVGYAASYEPGKQYVGDIYANFSVAEQYPEIMHRFAENFSSAHRGMLGRVDKVVGAQMGGFSIAQFVAYINLKRFAYIEKEITALKTPTSREESSLKFIRHTIQEGERILLMEDVLNNFSTTAKTIQEIEKAGGHIVAIGGLLNRSLTVTDFYPYKKGVVPVAALINKPFEEYEQNDLEVINDIEKGNVIWKPKNNWGPLAEAMEKHSKVNA